MFPKDYSFMFECLFSSLDIYSNTNTITGRKRGKIKGEKILVVIQTKSQYEPMEDSGALDAKLKLYC